MSPFPIRLTTRRMCYVFQPTTKEHPDDEDVFHFTVHGLY